jgi:VIT1/CCC1 family predicted Fe2+/Mn2+ transporter
MTPKQTLILYVRNFIFGAEDSLVSTVGLLSGIALAGMSRQEIIVSGIILILVEAFSMSVGSFLSERSTEEADQHFKQNNRTLGAALIMFISYFGCGLIPLSPYLLLSGSGAFYVSIIASLVALFILGLVSARILKTHQFKNALRMLVIGGLAILLGVAVGQIAR